ncbi:hypothetical protein VIGAN_11161000 [Vigna angularis var. angularis]|nr:hypothetical protein VIGAN_11161000 [Vigna angularis var. angularis]
MVILLTIPSLDALRKGLIAVTRNLLKLFLSVVPFCLFLLMDIYWKYKTRPNCEGESCTPSEHLCHQKSIMKSRNALLIASALLIAARVWRGRDKGTTKERALGLGLFKFGSWMKRVIQVWILDAANYSSSDLFELDHLSVMGNNRYREELPVYETTHVNTNRAIANGLIM